MTAETGKHTKAQSAHSGIFGNRDLIKEISVQRRVSATFTYNLHPHNTPENAYLMAIHAHWARIVNRKQFAHPGRFVSHKNTTNRRGNMTSLHRIVFDKTAAVFVSFPLLYFNVCLRLPQYKPCNINSVSVHTQILWYHKTHSEFTFVNDATNTDSCVPLLQGFQKSQLPDLGTKMAFLEGKNYRKIQINCHKTIRLFLI